MIKTLILLQRHGPPHPGHGPHGPPCASIGDWIPIALVITALIIAIIYTRKNE